MANKSKILIVDDEHDFIDVLKDRLEFEGYQVLRATDGKTGLEIMRKGEAGITLLDLMMPEMDGFKFLKIVNKDEKLAKQPLIVVTAYGRVLSAQEEGVIGARPLVRKPFDVEKLLKLIKDQIS
ncbi:MAG: response regulator [Pseudomonadota bacterium]